MSAGHTPAPWKHLQIFKSGELLNDFVLTSDGTIVADVADPKDAPVITAAPDLLAVAQDMLPSNLCLTNSNIPDSTVVPLDVTLGELRKIAAVVAKATGA